MSICPYEGPEVPSHCSLRFQGDTGAQGLPGPPGEDGERVSALVRAGAGLRRSLEGQVESFSTPSLSRVTMERLGPGGCLESR